MAKFRKCKDCGQEISKSAKACPHCGKPQVRTSGCAWLALIVIIVIVIGAISQMGKQSPPTPVVSAPKPPITKPESTTTPDALTMMSVVFEGKPSRAQLQPLMDKALGLYNLPVSEDSYHRAGSALLELRKSTKVPELDILQCMIAAYTPGVALKFPDSAAICATMLQKKETPTPQ